MRIKFSKMHGLGNDFIVINNLQQDYKLTAGDIRQLADRKLGVGCDQLLLIDPANDGQSDFYYRIYNSDGSVAGQCGNGARCFIRYLSEHNLTNKTLIQLQTDTRTIRGQVLSSGLVRVDMGQPEFTPALIPLALAASETYHYQLGDEMEFSALSLGNPHAVVQLASQAELEQDDILMRRAQGLQNSGLFPQGVNVNFVWREHAGRILLRTYERGCGFTLACGSGACASAAALMRLGLADSSLVVSMALGDLKIDWAGKELYMEGSATLVFTGEIELCAN